MNTYNLTKKKKEERKKREEELARLPALAQRP